MFEYSYMENTCQSQYTPILNWKCDRTEVKKKWNAKGIRWLYIQIFLCLNQWIYVNFKSIWRQSISINCIFDEFNADDESMDNAYKHRGIETFFICGFLYQKTVQLYKCNTVRKVAVKIPRKPLSVTYMCGKMSRLSCCKYSEMSSENNRKVGNVERCIEKKYKKERPTLRNGYLCNKFRRVVVFVLHMYVFPNNIWHYVRINSHYAIRDIFFTFH